MLRLTKDFNVRKQERMLTHLPQKFLTALFLNMFPLSAWNIELMFIIILHLHFPKQPLYPLCFYVDDVSKAVEKYTNKGKLSILAFRFDLLTKSLIIILLGCMSERIVGW